MDNSYESFSDDTELVKTITCEIDGWQNRPTDPKDLAYTVSGEIFVAATAKHFVGDGGTRNGIDQGDVEITESELRRIHLPPYLDAIRRNVQTVMVSFSSWNGLKMHANHYLVTKVLKIEMGFKGVVVSDWEAINQISGNYADQIRASINAGIDMVMVPTTYKRFISVLKKEVLERRVSMERIDDAVTRILKLKTSLGLFENACAPRQLLSTVGSKEHRDIARQAVRESLVLLKNNRRSNGSSMFPLPLENAKILVTGSHSHNIGLQCGGWTIEWQGASGDITIGTTILESIKTYVGRKAQVQHVENFYGNEEADYGIVVIGEQPYAEGSGDRDTLELDNFSKELIRKVCRKMPCVVILICGRPLEVFEILPEIDSLIIAWLPGSEGDGVSDVLFGNYDFKGRLPMRWPVKRVNIKMSKVDENDKCEKSDYSHFPFGFGLNKRGEELSHEEYSVQNRMLG